MNVILRDRWSEKPFIDPRRDICGKRMGYSNCFDCRSVVVGYLNLGCGGITITLGGKEGSLFNLRWMRHVGGGGLATDSYLISISVCVCHCWQ